MKYILWALLAYFIYRFVFNFIIPLFRASRDIKKQVNEFKNRMQEQQGNFQEPTYSNTPTQTPAAGKTGDYIEFEEIKER